MLTSVCKKARSRRRYVGLAHPPMYHTSWLGRSLAMLSSKKEKRKLASRLTRAFQEGSGCRADWGREEGRRRRHSCPH